MAYQRRRYQARQCIDTDEKQTPEQTPSKRPQDVSHPQPVAYLNQVLDVDLGLSCQRRQQRLTSQQLGRLTDERCTSETQITGAATPAALRAAFERQPIDLGLQA